MFRTEMSSLYHPHWLLLLRDQSPLDDILISDWVAVLVLADSHHAQDLVRRGERVVGKFDDQPPVVGSAGAVRLGYHVLPGENELVNGLLPLPSVHQLPLVSLAPLSLVFVNALVGEAEIITVIVIVVILVVRVQTRAAGCFVRRLPWWGRERNPDVVVPGLDDRRRRRVEEGGGLWSQQILTDIDINLVLLTVTVAE